MFIEKEADKQRKNVEKGERKNRLLMMEFTQYKKEASNKLSEMEKENEEENIRTNETLKARD